MKEIYRDKRFVLTQYSGTIEALGPFTLANSDARSYGDISRLIDYIRMAENGQSGNNGEVHMIKEVATYDLVDSYTALGVSGTFWFLNSTNENSTKNLVAAEIGNRYVQNFASFAGAVNKLRQLRTWQASLWTLLSLPLMLFFFVGLIPLAFGLWKFYERSLLAPINVDGMTEAVRLSRANMTPETA